MRSLTRVYCHYEQWEEYRWGMWRIIDSEERAKLAPKVIDILVRPELFRASLYSALMRWPMSVAVNCTNRSMNRAAWLWHAGACIATGAPEDVTRSVWMQITDAQRAEADRTALDVVHEWEHEYLVDSGVKYRDVKTLYLPATRMQDSREVSGEVLQEA